MKKNKYLISFLVLLFLIVLFVMTTSSIEAYSLDDVLFVEPYLETDAIFTDIARSIGKWIFDILGSILNLMESGFLALMKWDILQLEKVSTMMTNMNTVVTASITLVVVAVILMRMMKVQNPFKTLYTVGFTLAIISVSVLVLARMNDVKNASMKEAKLIVGQSENAMMSEIIFKDNTVDILKSMEEGKVIYVSDLEQNNLKYLSLSERIKRADLNEYHTYDEEGGIGTLDDGIFGIGDERYYRYRSDYLNINFTILASIVVYALAIFKGAYLLWQWLSVNLLGKVGLLKGFWEVDLLWKTFRSALHTLAGMVILYFFMLVFTVMCSQILSDTTLNNWIVKAVTIFSIGMGIITGSGYVNDVLGIDDGSMSALKNIFMAGRLSRVGGKMKDSLTPSFHNNSDKSQKGNNTQPSKDQDTSPDSDNPNNGSDAYDDLKTAQDKVSKDRNNENQATTHDNGDNRFDDSLTSAMSNEEKQEAFEDDMAQDRYHQQIPDIEDHRQERAASFYDHVSPEVNATRKQQNTDHDFEDIFIGTNGVDTFSDNQDHQENEKTKEMKKRQELMDSLELSKKKKGQ